MKKIALLMITGLVSFYFLQNSYAETTDSWSKNESSSEETSLQTSKVVSKSTEDNTVGETMNKQAEIDHKANDIITQEKSVAVLQSRLDDEKAQLKEMQDQFCKNFPSDCGKIGRS